MLIEINGYKVIKEIHEKTTNDSLKSFCEQTLNFFDEKYPDLKYWLICKMNSYLILYFIMNSNIESRVLLRKLLKQKL